MIEYGIFPLVKSLLLKALLNLQKLFLATTNDVVFC